MKESTNIIKSSVLISFLSSIVPVFGPFLSGAFTEKMIIEEEGIDRSSKIICLSAWVLSVAFFSWLFFSVVIKEESLMYINIFFEAITLAVISFRVFKRQASLKNV